LSADGRAERIFVEFVSGNYFSMLGVNAVLGRTFTEGEGDINQPKAVAVLNHACWKRRFGGDLSAVGKTIRLNGRTFTIIGIAPEEFPGMEPWLELDLYIPIGAIEILYPGSRDYFVNREDTQFRAVARMKPGGSIEQVRAALDVLARQLQDRYPAANRGIAFEAALESRSRPIIQIADTFSQIAGVFMGLVSLVLLIACANVANLMLARASTRQKELAIRIAIGATRSRLVRLLLIESLLLGALGGLAGILFAIWATDWFASIKLSTDAPVRFEANPDWTVFAFSFIIALLAGIISGTAPALQASRPDLNESLKEGGRQSAGAAGRQRLRSLLVVSQVAVSLLVLVCAGLFIKSARNAEKTDLGFRIDNLMMFSVDLELQGYDRVRGEQFYKKLFDRLNSMPGVQSVSMSRNVPFGYNNNISDVFIDELAATTGENKESVFTTIVGQNFFQTMGVPILTGRNFTEKDDESAPKVAIINRAMADRLWPGGEALGKRFRLNRDGAEVEVVGIARDWKYMFLGEAPRPFLFLPLAQNYRPEMIFYIHGESSAAGLSAAIRETVRELDSDLPIYDVKTMKSHLKDGIAFLFVRMGATLAGVFGMLGLILAMVGIYGVISYTVTQRTHEIGIRMALGASFGDVLRMIIGKGLLLSFAGIAIGLCGALAVTRVMSSLLYGVSPTDPITFLVITALLASVSLAASYIPARRAAKVDPMIALRHE
jgi:predicted permease